MNIYFSCSITGGRSDEETYRILVDELLGQGHTVPTAHLSLSSVVDMESSADAREIFLRDMGWLENCDAVVAEVSTPSHGVGYEIAAALGLMKPVFCCYKTGRKVSKIITGNNSGKITLCEYNNKEELLFYLHKFLLSIEPQP